MNRVSVTIIIVLFVKFAHSQEFTLQTQYEDYFTQNSSTLDSIEGFWIDDNNNTYSIKKTLPYTGIIKERVRQSWINKNVFDSLMNSNSMLFYEFVLIHDGVSIRNSLKGLTIARGSDIYFFSNLINNNVVSDDLGHLKNKDFFIWFNNGDQVVLRKIYPLKINNPAKSNDDIGKDTRLDESEKFFSDFDFNKYKEVILAILTLSFIWAIYFATKKIHKKVKDRTDKKFSEDIKKNDFLNNETTIIVEKEIEEKIVESHLEQQMVKEITKIATPETLKVSRKIRFFHLAVDLFLAYVFSYLVGYLFGLFQLSHIVLENEFLLGVIVLFVFYFSQEYLFGKTVGKFFTKTHVVDKTGNKPSFILLVVRTISRLIPFDAITYLSKEKRGLHDIFSTTYVIKD